MAQRTVTKKSARNDASSSNDSKSTGRSWRSEAKPVLPRRAAQAEIKIAYDQCGPETHGEKTCGTRLNTFILALRSMSKESPNHTHPARDLTIRCINKHYVTPWNREAVFQNLGVVQDLLRKWCHQFHTAAWPRRIMTTNFITTSQQRGSSLMGGEKTRTHHNTNQNVCGDICD